MFVENYLLQVELRNESPDWHCPFHLEGNADMPLSLKLGDSGQIPENIHAQPIRVSVMKLHIEQPNQLFYSHFFLHLLQFGF